MIEIVLVASLLSNIVLFLIIANLYHHNRALESDVEFYSSIARIAERNFIDLFNDAIRKGIFKI